jgi:hypothetical protein
MVIKCRRINTVNVMCRHFSFTSGETPKMYIVEDRVVMLISWIASLSERFLGPRQVLDPQPV